MLHPDLTVTDLVLRRPEVLPVLGALGIDTCCGGDQTLERAAECAGLDWDELRARLEAVPEPTDASPAPPCGCGSRHR